MQRARPFVWPGHLGSAKALGALALLCTMAIGLGCTHSGAVERIEDGRRDLGRLVPAEAYAAYLAGIEHEAAGRLDDARAAYDDARRLDPESGAAWAALGRVGCSDAPERALRTFAEGLSRARERLPLLLARAACFAEQGQLDRALSDARSALELAPTLPPVTALYAALLERLGRSKDAAAARLALALYRRSAAENYTDAPDVAAVDQALFRGHVADAERLALGLLGSGELALRALALGQPESARRLAALALAAEPTNADAAAVLLLTGDSPGDFTPSGDAPEFDRLSSLGACLLGEHVAARSSAASWNPALTPEETPSDPLLASCRSRLLSATAR